MQMGGLKNVRWGDTGDVQTDRERGKQMLSCLALLLQEDSGFHPCLPILCGGKAVPRASCRGRLSAQLAGALALSAAAFPSGQVKGACASLAAAASLLVVGVRAAGRRGAREAGRGAAAAQAASSPTPAVFMAGGRGADRALKRGGAAWGGAGTAVVVGGTGQTADAHPGAPMLG